MRHLLTRTSRYIDAGMFILAVVLTGFTGTAQSINNPTTSLDERPMMRQEQSGITSVDNYPGETVITIQPGPETGTDAQVTITDWNPEALIRNYGGDEDIVIWAWTIQSIPVTSRVFLRFDLSFIDAPDDVVSAKLFLYNNPNSRTLEGKHQFGSCATGKCGYKSNACWIRRVAAPWTEYEVTWDNQPATSGSNQVTLPTSKTQNQNYPDIDVTKLVRDMLSIPQGDFGLSISLKEEDHYCALIFASSDNANPDIRPKLVVTLNAPTDLQALPSANNLSIGSTFPHPVQLSSSGSPSVSITTPGIGAATLDLYDALGRHISRLYQGDEAGSRIVSFNPSTLRLAAGVYVYSLSWQGAAVRKQMIIR